MAKVLGIGGVFFKSPDPAKLRAWYAQWLGFAAGEYGANFMPATMPPGGLTVWNPFDAKTDYFAPSQASFMINLVWTTSTARWRRCKPAARRSQGTC